MKTQPPKTGASAFLWSHTYDLSRKPLHVNDLKEIARMLTKPSQNKATQSPVQHPSTAHQNYIVAHSKA